MEKCKRIMDSVHGYITIPETYCDRILDTPYFQRLRRVEQTSARTLFPSARHDRFIHSLGVFHLGYRLCQCLEEKNKAYEKDGNKNKYDYPEDWDKVFESFRLACLLHDVGHSPFSHTFENYYDNGDDNLRKALVSLVEDENFDAEWSKYIKDSKPHEIMSAYVALSVYRDFIKERKAYPDLIARMIVGCRYPDERNESFKNAFIELLHSDVLDVDGLDYACRDVWASGYSTFTIDVDRLLSSVYVVKDKNDGNKFTVCYSTKAINEIISVLGVKSFQSAYVFCHHIVVYEQTLLVKAMESAAMFVLGKNYKAYADQELRTAALRSLCDYNSMLKTTILGSDKGKFPLLHPSDDDFVRLMKFIPDDYYVQQWLSRTYDLVPLWKSVVECRVYFKELLKESDFVNFLNSENCRQFIVKQFNYEEHRVWLCSDIGPKDKVYKSSDIILYVNNNPERFSDLFMGDKLQVTHTESNFVYYFVPPFANSQPTKVDDIINAIIVYYKEQKAALA